jgi:hypothetical protein
MEEQVIATLETNNQDLLKNLKFIKNSIIGNPTKKLKYLNCLVIPRLQGCFNSNSPELCIEIANVIASLAYGSATSEWPVILLFDALYSDNLKLVEASARAIRCINSPVDLNESYISNLIRLADPFHMSTSPLKIHIAEIIISIITNNIGSPANQTIFLNMGLIRTLCSWLADTSIENLRIYESVIEALANLCKQSHEIAKQIAYFTPGDEQILAILLRIVRHTSPSLRLSAATCLVYIYKMLLHESQIDVTLTLLPTVIRFFSDSSNLAMEILQYQRALFLFADLVGDNADLQAVVMDGDVVTKLANLINTMIQNRSLSVEKSPKISAYNNLVAVI